MRHRWSSVSTVLIICVHVCSSLPVPVTGQYLETGLAASSNASSARSSQHHVTLTDAKAPFTDARSHSYPSQTLVDTHRAASATSSSQARHYSPASQSSTRSAGQEYSSSMNFLSFAKPSMSSSSESAASATPFLSASSTSETWHGETSQSGGPHLTLPPIIPSNAISSFSHSASVTTHALESSIHRSSSPTWLPITSSFSPSIPVIPTAYLSSGRSLPHKTPTPAIASYSPHSSLTMSSDHGRPSVIPTNSDPSNVYSSYLIASSTDAQSSITPSAGATGASDRPWFPTFSWSFSHPIATSARSSEASYPSSSQPWDVPGLPIPTGASSVSSYHSHPASSTSGFFTHQGTWTTGLATGTPTSTKPDVGSSTMSHITGDSLSSPLMTGVPSAYPSYSGHHSSLWSQSSVFFTHASSSTIHESSRGSSATGYPITSISQGQITSTSTATSTSSSSSATSTSTSTTTTSQSPSQTTTASSSSSNWLPSSLDLSAITNVPSSRSSASSSEASVSPQSLPESIVPYGTTNVPANYALVTFRLKDISYAALCTQPVSTAQVVSQFTSLIEEATGTNSSQVMVVKIWSALPGSASSTSMVLAKRSAGTSQTFSGQGVYLSFGLPEAYVGKLQQQMEDTSSFLLNQPPLGSLIDQSFMLVVQNQGAATTTSPANNGSPFLGSLPNNVDTSSGAPGSGNNNALVIGLSVAGAALAYVAVTVGLVLHYRRRKQARQNSMGPNIVQAPGLVPAPEISTPMMMGNSLGFDQRRDIWSFSQTSDDSRGGQLGRFKAPQAF